MHSAPSIPHRRQEGPAGLWALSPRSVHGSRLARPGLFPTCILPARRPASARLSGLAVTEPPTGVGSLRGGGPVEAPHAVGGGVTAAPGGHRVDVGATGDLQTPAASFSNIRHTQISIMGACLVLAQVWRGGKVSEWRMPEQVRDSDMLQYAVPMMRRAGRSRARRPARPARRSRPAGPRAATGSPRRSHACRCHRRP